MTEKPSPDSTKSGENIGLLKLNDHKAGMQGLDTERINQIIEEASKGSKFYQHKQKNQERINQKISELKASHAKLTEDQKKAARTKMDNLAQKMEKLRDLSRTAVHVDMDAFYAAVEMRDRPELKEVPMAVGSSAMLTTSNYHARRYGVRAAMPGFIAKKLCPELVIVPTNFQKYREVSQEVQKIFADYDPEFSAASLDEAYLDITDYLNAQKDLGNEITAAQAVQEMRERIFQKTQLTASAGIAPNGMLAKVCSDRNKPNGQFVLPNERDAVMEFVRDLPIRKISGIGNVTEQLLGAIGVKTCHDLWEKRELLCLLFTECSYEHFLRVALGIGSTSDGSDANEVGRKSVSCETTFRSTSNRDELCDIIRQLSADLSQDLVRHRVSGRTVTLKYKTDSFDVKTRATQLTERTSDGAIIAKAAVRLLMAEPAELTMRLLGVRMSQLTTTPTTSTDSAGSGAVRKQQRTLDQLLAECSSSSSAKRRKLDDGGGGDEEPALFTCPVCHSWRTPDGDVALNRHMDECLNQQVLLAERAAPPPPPPPPPSLATRKPPPKHHSAGQSKLDQFFTRK